MQTMNLKNSQWTILPIALIYEMNYLRKQFRLVKKAFNYSIKIKPF